MLCFSLIFYAWGGPGFLLLLLAMVFISWIGALAISSYDRWKKPVFIITLVLMLGLIGYFKYFGFLSGGLQALIGFPQNIPDIVLPIGISFYTFQLISYVVDVYRGTVESQRHYWKLLLFASLFHQCIAGPIVRYQDIEKDIDERKISSKEMGKGIKRFSVGLAKKAVMANGCAAIADTFLVTEDMTALSIVPAAGLFLGVAVYMLEIYLDFSAYSDMAVGMGLMIGFHYRENFNYPYISSSITDFWHRWHISLSTFFRDYVYIPLGGSRKGFGRQIVNLLIVWSLTGLWHGAGWNFIFWGLYFFVFLVLEKKWFLKAFDKLPKGLSHVYTLVVVFFGFIIFRFDNTAGIGIALKGLFGLNGNGFSNMTVGLSLSNNIFFLMFAVIACTPLMKMIHTKIVCAYRSRNRIPYLVYGYEIALPVVMLVISMFALVGNSYNPFLYFRF